MAPEREALGPNTKTTLGVAVTCVSVFLGGALWINNSLGSVERSVLDVGHRIELLDLRLRTLEGAADDRWRRSDMRAWVRDTKERNPTLSFPVVD